MAPEMFGPYRLDGLLGRGGMGRVFRAFDTEMDRTVALKVLTAELSGDPEYRDRFRREAKVASGLTDPHVVPIHRHGEIGGQLFLDMRLVDGDDLFQVLRDTGPLDADAAVLVIEQVASALDAAHEAGLVHRDVKPANVFLTRPRPGSPRFAYLGDFGIARQTSGGSLTATGATVGTLDYMAPERFRGLEVDGRADVYALGCLLHETLTARRPFPDTEPAALMGSHLTGDPPRPSDHAAVPTGLDAVVARAMAKEPADRFPSAGTLAAAARAVLAPPAGSAVTDRIDGTAARSAPGPPAGVSPAASPGGNPVSAPGGAGPAGPAPSWPPPPVRPTPSEGPPGPTGRPRVRARRHGPRARHRCPHRASIPCAGTSRAGRRSWWSGWSGRGSATGRRPTWSPCGSRTARRGAWPTTGPVCWPPCTPHRAPSSPPVTSSAAPAARPAAGPR